MAQGNQNVPVPSQSEQFANLISRFRLLEERQGNLQRKVHLMEENMLSSTKDTKTEIKLLHSELDEIKHQIKDFNEFVSKISSTLEDLATREEVKLVERYVNLLDPTNFISRKQLEREVDRAVSEKLSSLRGGERSSGE